MTKILFRRLQDGAKLPKQADHGSSGWDLFIPEDQINFKAYQGKPTEYISWEGEKKIYKLILHPDNRILLKLGFAVKLPEMHEWQIRPRSSVGGKMGLIIPNSPGTIDSSYTGEIGVLLFNASDRDCVIQSGQRIAQAILAKYENQEFAIVEELPKTERGEGGFGSSGKF